VTPARREVSPRRITPELMAFYKRRGHELRAEAWLNIWRRLWAALRRTIEHR